MLIRQDAICTSYFGEQSTAVWKDDTYFVAAFDDAGAVRLDIHRHDERDGITWDELRRLKNECGYADKDAVEYYPRDADIINTGNHRHLYVFPDPLIHVRRVRQL